MKQDVERKLNLALVGVVLLSAFCWVCLYAAFADFAQAGFELMAQPGLGHSVIGAGMVALHALGLLLLFVLAGVAAAAVVRSPRQAVRQRHANGAPH
jgi:hypothetical protein